MQKPEIQKQQLETRNEQSVRRRSDGGEGRDRRRVSRAGERGKRRAGIRTECLRIPNAKSGNDPYLEEGRIHSISSLEEARNTQLKSTKNGRSLCSTRPRTGTVYRKGVERNCDSCAIPPVKSTTIVLRCWPVRARLASNHPSHAKSQGAPLHSCLCNTNMCLWQELRDKTATDPEMLLAGLCLQVP